MSFEVQETANQLIACPVQMSLHEKAPNVFFQYLLNNKYIKITTMNPSNSKFKHFLRPETNKKRILIYDVWDGSSLNYKSIPTQTKYK